MTTDFFNSLFSLHGKVAFITGASSNGLGAQFAHTLATAGANVVLVARREKPLKKLAQIIEEKYSVKAHAISTDVSNPEDIYRSVEEAIQEFGQIDILINNAGVLTPTAIGEVDREKICQDWDHLMNVNLRAPWLYVHEVSRHMISKKIEGSIINISSIAGGRKNQPMPGLVSYSASKAGLDQMTRGLVQELSPHKIRINNISPGFIITDTTRPMLSQIQGMMLKAIPAGFLAEPKELDALVLYLASNKASKYVTGSIHTIDGGTSYIA